MTALIALLALSTYAPAASSPAADALSLNAPANSPVALTAEPLALAPAAVDEPKQGPFSYSFIEANYLWTDFDGDDDFIDDALDGWEARISFEIPLNIFFQASYGEVSGDADLNTWRIGAGWHLPIGENFDLYGILSVLGEEIDDSEYDEDGIAAEVGGRVFLGKSFELNARGTWIDLEDSDVSLGVGGRFYFNPKLSAGLNVDAADERETYAAGLRFQF